jgi:TRAP-type C4-dicarboxylate transport system permease small subunit
VSPDPSDDEPSDGHLQPTSAGLVTMWAVAGLVGGWLLHPVAERVSGTAPVVTWLQPIALFLVAAILGAAAWATWRAVHVRREWLEPQRAVNRLLLARSCALVGALVAGGYLGYGLSWVGSDSALAGERGWRSLAAGVAGALIVVAALLLERACRTRSEDEQP